MEVLQNLLSKYPREYPVLVAILCGVGLYSIAKLLLGMLNVAMENYLTSGVNLKKLGSDSYALITGATDGIGKEFAHQLARKGFNVIIVSRTASKLALVKKEIEEKHNVQVKTLAVDFSKVTAKDYDSIRTLVSQVPVSILVNNVAMNHLMPTPFVEESEEVLDNIINVNIGTTVKLTHICLPHMIQRKAGLVLNVGSFAGMAPTPLLQTYSGSKAFMRTWSEALAYEVKPLGVHVEHLNTYFVVSNMSKINRPSAMIPTAKRYVESVLGRVGVRFNSTPYPHHNWMRWILETLISKDLLLKKTLEMQLSVRKRALRKLEKSK